MEIGAFVRYNIEEFMFEGGDYMKKITLVISCIFLCMVLTGCGGKSNAESLASFGKEQFLENDYDTLIQDLREKSGLDDLEATVSISYDYENDYDKEQKFLSANCVLHFRSDDIDDYYTTDYNSNASEQLAKVLNGLKFVYDDNKIFKYTNLDGTVVLHIPNGRSLVYITVKTSNERTYELSCVTDWDTVMIDDDYVYMKEVRNDYTTSSNDNSYTGAYDATLKYSGTDGVLICVSEDAMDRFMTAVNNGNEGTLEELFLDGQCAYTEQGTKCNIVDRKLTKCQVKLLDGSYSGNTVWVVIEALQEE